MTGDQLYDLDSDGVGAMGRARGEHTHLWQVRPALRVDMQRDLGLQSMHPEQNV
jgi:hypothetical protein